MLLLPFKVTVFLCLLDRTGAIVEDFDLKKGVLEEILGCTALVIDRG